MIQFVNACKVYADNGVKALQDVNLEIDNGEFVFFVGPSGSGKSTMLKLLMREEKLTSGSIMLDDVNISELPKKKVPFLRRKLGTVFQDFRLLPNKTVYENVAFSMQIVEAPHREIRRAVPSVLALVGLSKKAKSYPHQLSGGEQQRTAIARAIVNAPPLLLADEPTGNLDPDTAWEIMKLLEFLNERGTTIIVATHAWDIVDDMQKRVIRLRSGKMIQDIEKGGYDNES